MTKLFRRLGGARIVVVCVLALLAGVVGVCVLQSHASLTPEEQAKLRHDELMTEEVFTIEDLADVWTEEAWSYIRVAIPGATCWTQTKGPLPFDPEMFPKSFLDGLIGYYEGKSKVPIYEVTIYQDRLNRDICFLNSDYKLIYAMACPYDKDCAADAYALKRYPDLFSGKYAEKEIEEIVAHLDPARVLLRVQMIPSDQLYVYLLEQAMSADSAGDEKDDEKEDGGEGAKTGGGSNDLWVGIEGPAAGLTNIEISAHLPGGFTNRIEIFRCTNLLDFWWTLAATNLSAEGTNIIYWTYDVSGVESTLFFAAGNADVDSDGDGIVDARENFLYHTDAGQWDTDGDGASDGDEVAAGTNPLNNPGDNDGDGLSDDLEIVLGTDPDEWDTDGDEMGDGWEVQNGLNPLAEDALLDPDGDGYFNIYESTHLSDPQAYTSIPTPTLIVTNGGSIQAALDAATNDYDVVSLVPGTYIGAGNKDLDFAGKKLILASEGGASETAIDCQNAGRGFYFHSGEGRASVVSGITVRNGCTNQGGAIYCTGSSPTISFCRLLDNRADVYGLAGFQRGGAIYCTATSSPAVKSTLIRGNTAVADGGGLFALDSQVVLEDCTVVVNNARSGAGLLFSRSPGAEVRYCYVASNTAATIGGGVHCLDNSAVLLKTSKIEANTAMNGGGIGCWESAPTATQCRIVRNVANTRAYSGGGVFAGDGSSVLLENCLLADNRATNWGGAVSVKDGSAHVLNCTLINNDSHTMSAGNTCRWSAITWADETHSQSNGNMIGGSTTLSGSGGGIFAWKQTGGSTVTVENAVLWTNLPDQARAHNGAVCDVDYSVVQGGAAGTSNLLSNPLLTRGGYLRSTSPCVDKGNAAAAPPTDIHDEARPQGAGIDMGFDEFMDSDADILPDWWEVEFFGSSTGAVEVADSDTDGVTNADEYVIATDPTSNADSDGDVLSDDFEVLIGTDPAWWDSDEDTLPDGWEWQYDGFDPAVSNDANADTDTDGWSDGQEADQGTNPTTNDTDGDLVLDYVDADPLDGANTATATADNTVWITLEVGDSSGSHTELYLINVGPFTLRMPHVTPSDYLFSKAFRAPSGKEYQGYVESLPDDDGDGDYDADVSGERIMIDDPDGVLGGHHEDSGFNSGKRYFTVFTLTNAPSSGVRTDSGRDETVEPISTISGNVVLDETDIVIPCPGLGIIFARSYNNRSEYTNAPPLGYGWTHSLDEFLFDRTNTTYRGVTGDWKVLQAGTGSRYWFKAQTNGTYGSPAGINASLEAAGSNYVLTLAGGLTETFNSNGLLQAASDAFGNTLTFVYTNSYPNHRLARVEHVNGQGLEFGYAGDLLVSITTPSTDLSAVFSYNPSGELTNATRSVSGGQQVTRYFYDAATHSLTQRVNASGDKFNYAYEYVTNDVGATVARGVAMVLDSAYYAHTVNYTNQGNDRTEVVYARGATNQTYIYEYDPSVSKITAVYGPNTTNIAVIYELDAALNTRNEIVTNGSLGQFSILERSYDGHHKVTTERIGYNSAPLSPGWRYTWHPSYDTLTSILDPEDHKTEFEYTNALVSVARQCVFSNQSFDTTYSYTTNGLLIAVTNADGHWIHYSYDQYGYLSVVEPEAGPSATFEHNVLGQLEQVVVPGDAGPRTSTFTRDALGRLLAGTYPDGTSESFSYDAMGNLTNHVDTAGRTKCYAYAPTRKLTSFTRTLQGPTNHDLTISFCYDQQFNALSITDELGRAVESYVLDIQDRPVTICNLEGQTMNIAYGLGNYVLGVTRFDGSTVSNVYDNQGRLQRSTYPPFSRYQEFTYFANGLLKTASNQWVTYSNVISNQYDNLNRLVKTRTAVTNGVVEYSYCPGGQVSNTVSAAGTNSYAYDAAERVTTIQSPAGTFGYTYNTNNGLVASVTYPNGVKGYYAYDVMDRVTSIVWKDASSNTLRSFTYAYDAAGMVTNVLRENGYQVRYTYDGLYRLVGEVKLNASTSVVDSYAWAYDYAGNRTRMVRNGQTNNYTLGLGNRLASWTPSGSQKYDGAGNVTNIVYDASHNTKLTWTERYQLDVAYTNGAWAEWYQYDALGRRVMIAAAGETMLYPVYDGQNVAADVIWTGYPERKYVHGPGIDDVLATSVATYPGYATYYHIKDHLGSVVALVDATGTNMLESYEYDAWGNVTVYTNGAVAAKSKVGNRFLFQGREYSWKTKLYYFRARWYDPTTGRWLSNDPVGISGGLNQYVFAANNPANFADPLGLDYMMAEAYAAAWGMRLGPQLTPAQDAAVRAGQREMMCLIGSSAGPGTLAFADGFIPFVDPLALAGAYDANDPAFQASQAVGGVTRDVIAVIGGGGIGAAARAEGVAMSAGQRFLLGEFGPSLGSLITSAEPLSQASLWAGLALKWGARIDSYIKIRNAFTGGESYEQPDACE